MTEENRHRRQTDADDGVHWEITRQHANDISDLKASAARQEEVLASVLRAIDGQRESISTIIQKLSEPPPATDLAKLIGTAVTVMTMFGALGYAFISPMASWQKEADIKFDSIIEVQMEQQYKNGVDDAEMKAMKDHFSRLVGE